MMPSAWKWKSWAALAAILLSIYTLIPTIFGFQEIREMAELKNKPVPGYMKFFPQKGINLGLDLRGGMYLELDVDLDAALANRLDILLMDLERNIDKAKYPGLIIERIEDTLQVRVTLSKDKKDEFLKEIDTNFGDALDLATNSSHLTDPENTFILALTKKYSEYLYKTTLRQAEEAVRNRIDRYGVNEASIQLQGSNRLVVEVPGVKNPDRVIDIIQRTGALEFRMVDDSMTQAQIINLVQEARKNIGNIAVEFTDQDKFELERKLRMIDPNLSQPILNNIIDWMAKSKQSIAITDEEIKTLNEIAKRDNQIEFTNDNLKDAIEWLAKRDRSTQYAKVVVDAINKNLKGKIPADSEILFEIDHDPVTKGVIGGTPYLIKKFANVTGDMLRNAQVGYENNTPHVSLLFDKRGTKNFGDVTTANVGKRLAIVLDGVVNTTPNITEPITGGQAQITLGYNPDQNAQLEEAEDLALLLREGALPASLTVVNKTVIGPSLGSDSIREGLISMLVAAGVIVLFMMVYYKWGGVLANIALLLNILFVFAALAFLQASLSLPGIAGIILTMGMAVDANVVIFERMREERRAGKGSMSIIESGYSNAMSAIVDANITTFISGLVLYQFGTGPIKGFATTLMIGIVTTMVTAIVFTRLAYDYFLIKRKIKNVSI